MSNIFTSGTLATTQYVCDLNGCSTPSSVLLKTTSSTKNIEVSLDGGASWLPVIVDIYTSTSITVFLPYPVTKIRITGAIGDSWTITL